jgi:hypothetical protein
VLDLRAKTGIPKSKVNNGVGKENCHLEGVRREIWLSTCRKREGDSVTPTAKTNLMAVHRFR